MLALAMEFSRVGWGRGHRRRAPRGRTVPMEAGPEGRTLPQSCTGCRTSSGEPGVAPHAPDGSGAVLRPGAPRAPTSSSQWFTGSRTDPGSFDPFAVCELQKGGDPAAPSGTATLLRLRPNRRSHLRRLPPCGWATGFGCYRLS